MNKIIWMMLLSLFVPAACGSAVAEVDAAERTYTLRLKYRGGM